MDNSTNKNLYVNSFNNQLKMFVKVLNNRFQDDSDLKLFQTCVNTLVKCNAPKCIELFIFYVYPYKDKLISKDEEFILTNDFTKDNDLYSEWNFNVMNHLKNCWKHLHNDEKENIWKYLQILMTISEKYGIAHIQSSS